MDSQVPFSKILELYTPEEMCEALTLTIPEEVCKNETTECNTPTEVQIYHVGHHIGHRVVLSGNIFNIQRPKNSPMLVIITDGLVFLQCVASESVHLDGEAASFRVGDEIVVSGLVRMWDEKNPGPENFEVLVESWQLKKATALIEEEASIDDQLSPQSSRHSRKRKKESQQQQQVSLQSPDKIIQEIFTSDTDEDTDYDTDEDTNEDADEDADEDTDEDTQEPTSLTCIIKQCQQLVQYHKRCLEETLLACRAKEGQVLDCIQETFHSYLQTLGRVKNDYMEKAKYRLTTLMLNVHLQQDQLHSYSQQLLDPLLDLATKAEQEGTSDVDVHSEILAQYEQLVNWQISALNVPSSIECKNGVRDVEQKLKSSIGVLFEDDEFVSQDDSDISFDRSVVDLGSEDEGLLLYGDLDPKYSTCQDEVMDEDPPADYRLMSGQRSSVGDQPTPSDDPLTTDGTEEDDSYLNDWYLMMLMEDPENEENPRADQLEQRKDLQKEDKSSSVSGNTLNWRSRGTEIQTNKHGGELVENKNSREDAKYNASRLQDVVSNRQVSPVTPNATRNPAKKPDNNAKTNQTILPRKEVSKTASPNPAKTDSAAGSWKTASPNPAKTDSAAGSWKTVSPNPAKTNSAAGSWKTASPNPAKTDSAAGSWETASPNSAKTNSAVCSWCQKSSSSSPCDELFCPNSLNTRNKPGNPAKTSSTVVGCHKSSSSVCPAKTKQDATAISEQTEEERLQDFKRRHPKRKEPLTIMLDHVPLPRKSQRKN